jgi:hypothetical protein
LGGLGLQELVELAEPVAAPVDVDDVHVMEEAVEDRGGEDLVTREDLRPVAHVFVRGQDDRSALAACADQPEEEVGLMPVERAEADLIDDQKRAVEVAFRLQPGRRDGGIGLERMQQVVEDRCPRKYCMRAS